MPNWNRDTSLEVKPLLLIWIAVSIVVLPIQWVAAWCAAVTVHELSHYIALRICGCRVYSVQLRLFGAVMEAEQLTNWKEVICALAGPFGSLSLLIFAKWLPRTAICGVLHAVYNLLPVFPMDGGRVLRCLLKLFLPEKNRDVVEKVVGYFVKAAVLLAGSYGSFCLRLGALPILVAAALIVKNIKIPCKERLQRVQ